MRILRIYAFLPPLPGGMEKHVQRLSEEQRQRGCQVTVAFNRGCPTAPCDIQVARAMNLRPLRPQALRDAIFYASLVVRLWTLRGSFDVAHVHGDWSAFLFGRLLARLLKVPRLVGSLHNRTVPGLRKRLYGPALRGYALVYATGARDAEKLAALTGRQVFWQTSGIDCLFGSSADVSERRYDVVTVGTFVPRKNYELVLAIASLLPGLRFLLVGDGPERQAMEERVARSGLHNVHFAGHVDAGGVARHLSQSRLFLLTSFHEGTPTALLEAMAVGLPVVTSRSNDYSEIVVSGVNGYVIDGFEAVPYAQRIAELLADEDGLAKMGERNREQAGAFLWPRVADRITRWMRSSV